MMKILKRILTYSNKVISFISPYVNTGISFVLVILFLYTFFLIGSNLNRGFDITDESFYLLWAMHPEDVLSWFSRFGFYTNILYSATNENIMLFRLTGLLLLMFTTGIFWFSLQRYWNSMTRSNSSVYSHWPSFIAMLSCVFAFNNMWLLTPSYNWLALISTLLVGIGLLQAALKANVINLVNNSSKLYKESILIGIGGSLAFFAKPTTAAILVLVFLYWISVTPLRHKWKPLFISSVLSSILVLFIHSFLFEGSPILFYKQLQNGLELGKLLDGGYSGKDLLLQAYRDITYIPKYLTKAGGALITLVSFFIFIIIIQNKLKRFQSITIPLTIIPISVSILAWLQLWKRRQWVGGDNIGTYIGYPGIAFSIFLLLSALLLRKIHLSEDQDNPKKNNIKPLLYTYFLLLFFGVAYAFGSNIGLIRQMSFAFIFIAASALVTAQWIDQYTHRQSLEKLISLLLILSMFFVTRTAYDNPYRMPGTIDDQNTPVTFIGRPGTLLVDTQTARYIDQLKKLALDGDWTSGTPLIDLTGGTPGATVILNGRFVAIPWLLGGYKGSKVFSYTALSLAPSSMIKSAWILTAPKGPRKIDPQILRDLGLDFPNGYRTLGTTRSGHRSEEQILFKPLANTSP